MLTLAQFIQLAPTGSILTNQYVRHPNFKSLYVRYNNRRYINGEFVFNVLDIANIQARKPGKGAFTKLIIHLRNTYPLLVLYVESIQNPRFADRLERMGFVYDKIVNKEINSMYLLPSQSLYV